MEQEYFERLAKNLSEPMIKLIVRIIEKHSKAILEEMYIELQCRSRRIKELERELEMREGGRL